MKLRTANSKREYEDEFMIYVYKIRPCGRREPHDWLHCPFAHEGERSVRRDPRAFKYSASACPAMKEFRVCPQGQYCSRSHNVYECGLHPDRYRTQMCLLGNECKRPACFFAHTTDQLRAPPPTEDGPTPLPADPGWNLQLQRELFQVQLQQAQVVKPAQVTYLDPANLQQGYYPAGLMKMPQDYGMNVRMIPMAGGTGVPDAGGFLPAASVQDYLQHHGVSGVGQLTAPGSQALGQMLSFANGSNSQHMPEQVMLMQPVTSAVGNLTELLNRHLTLG